MVDVGAKDDTERVAMATGRIRMQPATLATIREGGVAKGDVVGIAQTAAIMAAKRTWELIPLCHPLPLTAINVEIEPNPEESALTIAATVRTRGKTGVEMEALTAVSVGLLTIYDMCKAIDRGMEIGEIHLDYKAGGASGTWSRAGT